MITSSLLNNKGSQYNEDGIDWAAMEEATAVAWWTRGGVSGDKTT